MAERPGPRRIGDRAPAGTLGAVYRQARDLARLRRHLARALTPDLAPHLAGVSGDRARLVVYADSAAWATRLRYQAPVLEKAAADLLGARPRLVFRNVPKRERGQPAESDARGLTDAARATLESAARTIGDEELAAAIRRLARNR